MPGPSRKAVLRRRGETMTIGDLQKVLQAEVIGRIQTRAEVCGLSMHSREIRAGWVFIAIAGTHQDGAAFVEDAIRRGAVAVIASRMVPVPPEIGVLVVPDARRAAAQAAHAFFGAPSAALQMVGITGTNGKTTTATFLKQVLTAHGTPTGMLGTIAYEIGDRSIAATRTTPDAITLQHLLQGMVKAGCRAAVLEVSSHALVQQRTGCIDFAAAAFTNLTQDHLDYHGTMEAYYEAKAGLLRGLAAGRYGVVDTDDAWGARLAAEPLACGILRTGLQSAADVRGEILSASLEGTHVMVHSPWGDHAVMLQLPGEHNVRNALTCFALAGALGVPAEHIAVALGHVRSVRGRLQRVPSPAPFRVFVDYAHTDDALRHVLQELRRHTAGRLRVVFGCGGNRDTAKRVLMGQAVHAYADVAYITSDNPRHESPAAILAAIRSAFPADAGVRMELDRRAAIQLALTEAQPGDTVILAGKGHETYQEVEGRMLPFDDVAVASGILAALGYGGAV